MTWAKGDAAEAAVGKSENVSPSKPEYMVVDEKTAAILHHVKACAATMISFLRENTDKPSHGLSALQLATAALLTMANPKLVEGFFDGYEKRLRETLPAGALLLEEMAKAAAEPKDEE